ncbi:MAG TPA: hypothetical protein VGR57_01795 [Ktedonobacterales bacterium]|nr:hypothetical protein [Ktedonobacterales bacterium]
MAQGLTTAAAAAVKSKVGVAVLTALIATGGAAGTVAAAHQGAFGQQVKAQVDTCKDALKAGTHGIGDCVSDFASQHGQTERQQHSQSDSTSHGQPSSPGKSGSHRPASPGKSGSHRP